MAPEDAEQRLIEWVTVTRDRDTRVRAAVAAGLSKHRVHRLTGIGRSTIDRILAAAPGTPAAQCAKTVPDGGRNDH
jgi:hypothetical protein